ncbi:CHAT domain-containing protein, partial [Chloroflexota bacterium]
YEWALEYYQQSLTIVKDIGDRAGEGVILNNLGGIYDNLEQYEWALEYYQQSLIIRQEVGDRAGEGTSLNNIGHIYNNLGQYKRALDYYRQSLVIAKEVSNRAGEGTTLNNIGLVYDRLEQYEQALYYYQQAINVLEAIRSQVGSEQGRTSFIAEYAFMYRRAVDLFQQQNRGNQAFLTVERGRARAFLDSMTTGQVRLSDDESANLLAQEQELYAQRQALRFALTEARAANPPDPELVADLETQLAEAEIAYQAAQDTIAARGDQLASLVPGRSADYVLGVEGTQPLLDEQTTLLAYYTLEENILAFIITQDNFETVVLVVSPAELVTQLITFRDFTNIDATHPASAIALYEMLIAPLKDKLSTYHLAIIPHQALHYLPFAALTDGDRYLIDDYTLTVLPSASALPFIQENAQQTAHSDQSSALILGNPTTADYDTVASLATTRDSLGSLPYAEKEAKSIAALYGVEPLIGEAATEGIVRQDADEAGILHLAAHGEFNPIAPLNSLIALAPDDDYNGWLTVGEVYGLDLNNTDLVVLSACQTNLGDLSEGDELVGLTRAFIFAGTPSVIASLWNVEDEATSLLMERFYTHLKDGMGKAEALRQAQLEVREQYPNPYYWSGFVLSGDGGEVGEILDTTPTPLVTDEDQTQTGGGCLGLMVSLGALGVVSMIGVRHIPKRQISQERKRL